VTATDAAAVGRKGRSIQDRISAMTGGAAFYPLAILFGLNILDELDRNAFNVLLPEIRDYFGLDNTGILSVVALAGAAALLLTVPVSMLADRYSRVKLMVVGAIALLFFSFGTGLAPVLWVFIVMRCGTSMGLAASFPTHNSLLADYYPIPVRPRVYSFHAAARSIGVGLGVLIGAGLATLFDWRAPFIFFAIPGVILIILALRLREPVRGRWERQAMGADASLLGIEDEPPSFAEAYRMVWKIQSLRRIFFAMPFLAAAIVGFASLASLQYAETFGLSEVGRAVVMVPVQLIEVIGLTYGARLGVRRLAQGPSKVFDLLAWASVAAAVLGVAFAWAPWLFAAILFHALLVTALAIVGPGVLTALSLGIPPRARAIGFSIGALFVLPGLVAIPLVGSIGDRFGYRWGLTLMLPVFLMGGLAISRVGKVIDEDVKNVWIGTMARAEMMRERAEGRLELLSVRELGVAYGDVRVLFGVDLNVKEGEIIALLGTNGAGKSTLLKAISGVTEADRGAIVFDGRDMTHAPPEEIAKMGIAQVPGGQGVFPSLTVAENLQAAGWMLRKDKKLRDVRVAEVLELFPVLEKRSDDHAADLSGGQQQMLTLGMAFMSRPRLLMIDELSLGLAPVVIEQLLDVVRAMRDQGTAIILVEQSVNVALTVADTAYFMEKGEIRFHGPTAELLDRPDVLRSVFLEGATKGLASEPVPTNGEATPVATNGVDALPVVGVGASTNGDATELDAVLTHDRPTSEAVALEVREVSVSFGGIRAVDDVSFTLAKGEVLGIIGPNGAGKTTLFDLISGITKTDTGRVRLGADDISSLSANRRAWRGLGRSFQDSRLFPSLTVEDTLMVALERWLDVRDPLDAAFRLPAFVDSEAAARHRVDELIELMGIEAFRTKFVGELSTGSRRVVDLACVLAHEPSVVLLDEPSSGIAQREAEALGPLLLRIRDALEASLVVIEHDMGLVTDVSDRLLALDQGHVLASGTPDEVLSHRGGVDSYLGGDLAVIGRSGPRPEPSTEVPA
jgi:ABC-type branched-subunit amino acid transport system ATPase component/MFS family permease